MIHKYGISTSADSIQVKSITADGWQHWSAGVREVDSIQKIKLQYKQSVLHIYGSWTLTLDSQLWFLKIYNMRPTHQNI